MPRYRAFLSYSHTDEHWASWLHRELESYRIPRKLVGRDSPLGPIPRKLFPVFRDREELPTAQALSSEIERALSNSDSLIVICSPAAVRSPWVNEEIRRYKAQGHADRVFCLIVDGEPGDSERECFPEAIRYQVDAAGHIGDQPAEPIAADLRPGKDGKADAKLKLIAGLLGIGLNELKQRELAARNRRLTAISTVAVGVAAVTIGLAWVATQARNEAQAQRQIAESRQQQAEGLIQFMLGDLREKLEPIGKLEILDAVGTQAMAYFGQVDPQSLSDDELAARAKALRQIGDVRVTQGKLDEAEPALTEALALDRELLRRHPGDQQSLFNIGQSQFYVGYAHYLRGEHDEALRWFESYDRTADSLLSRDQQRLEWRQEKQYAVDTLATVHTSLGNYARCVDYLNQGLDAASSPPSQLQNDRDVQIARASGIYKRANCEISAGDFGAGTASLRQASELYDALATRFPDEPEHLLRHAVSDSYLGYLLLRRGEFAQARVLDSAAVAVLTGLVERDPSNAKWKGRLLALQVQRALTLALDGEPSAARTAAIEALMLATKLKNSVHDAEEFNQSVLQTAILTTVLVAGGPDLTAAREQSAMIATVLHNSAVQATVAPPRALLCAILRRAGHFPAECRRPSNIHTSITRHPQWILSQQLDTGEFECGADIEKAGLIDPWQRLLMQYPRFCSHNGDNT